MENDVLQNQKGIKKQLSVMVLFWLGVMAFLVFAYGVFVFKMVALLGVFYIVSAILLFTSLLLLIYTWKKGFYLFMVTNFIVLISLLAEIVWRYFPYLVGDPGSGGMGVSTVALFITIYLVCVMVLGLTISFVFWKNDKENSIN